VNKVQELITDPIAPKYRYIYVPLPHGNAMAGTYVSMGGGAAAMAEVGSSGVGGQRFEVSTDDVAGILFLPDDADVEHDIDVAVLWSSDQTTTDSYTWDVNYGEFTINTTAVAVPATALDTTIAADTSVATANALQQTAWGTITASTLSGTFSDGYLHLFEVDPSAVGGTPSSDVVVVYGVVFRYQPRKI